MRRSQDRVLVSHAGVLPRPEYLLALMADRSTPMEKIEAALPGAVAEVVRRQLDTGIDVVNDGELSKAAGFSSYVRDRMTGIEQRELRPGESPRTANKRDQRDFPGFYAAGLGQPRSSATRLPTAGGSTNPQSCVGPVSYIGQEAAQRDIRNLRAALPGPEVEAFLPAIAPGTVEHWLWNEYYPDDESFLYAIADALHEEYREITDAGIIVQIDDPDFRMPGKHIRRWMWLRIVGTRRSGSRP